MTIIRAPRPQSNFYQLDKRISEDKRLSWSARGMLIFLLGKPDHWKVSVPALVKETAVATKSTGRDAVYNLLAELITTGYAQRVKRADGALEYLICEPNPENPDVASMPLPEKPDPEKPDPDFQDALVSTDKAVRNEGKARTEDAQANSSTVSDLLGNEVHTPKAAHTRSPSCPVESIVDLYHQAMPDNPKCKVINKARIAAITARWKEAAALTCKPFGYSTVEQGLAAWRKFFETCADSDFLTGKSPPSPGRTISFIADLDFLTSPSKFVCCLENKYHRESQNERVERPVYGTSADRIAAHNDAIVAAFLADDTVSPRAAPMSRVAAHNDAFVAAYLARDAGETPADPMTIDMEQSQ